MLQYSPFITSDKKLFTAISNNKPALIKSLLESKSDQLIENEEGETPFQYAVKQKNWECVRAFIPFLEEKQLKGEALKHAVDDNQNIVARLLMIKGDELENCFTNKTGYFPIHTAIQNKNHGIVKDLLEHKANPSFKTQLTKDNQEEKTPLQIAIETNQPTMVRLLLEAKASYSLIKSINHTPLEYAAILNHWECVKVFIESLDEENVSLYAQYGYVLKCAIDNDESNIVRLLVNKKAYFNYAYTTKTGFYVLHTAIEHGKIAYVDLLLKNKADPAQKTKLTNESPQELTPLEIAIKYNHPAILKLLINANVDLNIKINNNQDLPIIYATNLHRWDCVKELIQCAQNLSAVDYEDVLLSAIDKEQNDVAVSLIKKKASFDKIFFTNTGYYSLHMAIEKNNIPLIYKLLEAKADPLTNTHVSKLHPVPLAPLDIALQKGNQEIINLFKNKVNFKKNKMEQTFSSIDSIYTANEAVNQCIDEYSITPKELIENLKIQTKDYKNEMLIVALYIKSLKIQNFLKIFENTASQGHPFLVKTILILLAKLVESVKTITKLLPQELKVFLRNFSKENEENISSLSNQTELQLIALKNRYKNILLKSLKGLENPDPKNQSFYLPNASRKILYKMAAIYYIQHKLATKNYNIKTIRYEIIAIFGKEVLPNHWFRKNHLYSIIQKLNAIHNSNEITHTYKKQHFSEEENTLDRPFANTPLSTSLYFKQLTTPSIPYIQANVANSANGLSASNRSEQASSITSSLLPAPSTFNNQPLPPTVQPLMYPAMYPSIYPTDNTYPPPAFNPEYADSAFDSSTNMYPKLATLSPKVI